MFKNNFLKKTALRDNYRLKERDPRNVENNRLIAGEEKVSELLVDALNTNNLNDEIPNKRTATLTNALYQSGSLSLFDDCYDTRELFAEVLNVKIRAHYNLFKSIIEYCENHELKKQDELIELSGYFSFTYHEFVDTISKFKVVRIQETKQTGEVINHVFSEMTQSGSYFTFNSYTYADGLDVGYKGENAIKRSGFNHLNFSYADHSKRDVRSFDNTLNMLGLLNHVATMLDVDFDLYKHLKY